MPLNTDRIRRAERALPATPDGDFELTDEEWTVYSALLVTDTDQYLGHSQDLPRRARAVAALLLGDRAAAETPLNAADLYGP